MPGRKRFGYPHVVSTIALFVALGGTSYAALNLPANSVGTPQIKNNAVTGAKVRNGSLTLADLKQAGILRGPTGPEGAKGPAGDTGGTGSPGAMGPSDGYWDSHGGETQLSDAANVYTTVARLSALPAGNYMFVATTDVANTTAGASMNCRLTANGTVLDSNNANVGGSYTFVGSIDVSAGATEAASFDAVYECTSTQPSSGTSPVSEDPSLIAIRVGTLHTQ